MKSGVSSIPILTFHALDETDAPISFSPVMFARALKRWHAEGWRTLSLFDAVCHLREGIPFSPKSFVMTFDDGYASVYRAAFPCLRKYGMTATLFIAPGEKGGSGQTPLPRLYGREMLRWNEIREMDAQGMDFGAHSLTHRDLTQLPEEELEREVRVSGEILQDALGHAIPFFCYPKGYSNARVREVTARYYQGACSDRLGIANSASDLYALERVEMFYLRAPRAADLFMSRWFPYYLAARNVPRILKRRVSRRKT